jgi:hypothetical protein
MRRTENRGLSHKKTVAGRIPLPSKKITCQNQKKSPNPPYCISKKNPVFAIFGSLFQKSKSFRG